MHLPKWEIHADEGTASAAKDSAKWAAEARDRMPGWLDRPVAWAITDPIGAARIGIIALLLLLALLFIALRAPPSVPTKPSGMCGGCSDAIPLNADLQPLSENSASH